MPVDPWFNILRTRLRRIPLEQRLHWSEDDLAEWVRAIATEREVVARALELPTSKRISEICRDLSGKDADE